MGPHVCAYKFDTVIEQKIILHYSFRLFIQCPEVFFFWKLSDKFS